MTKDDHYCDVPDWLALPVAWRPDLGAPPSRPRLLKPAPKRPGWAWMLFFGRRRRGFPGLLVGVLLAVLVLGLTFATRTGADLSYYAGIFFLVVIALLALGALALAVIASLRRPGGR